MFRLSYLWSLRRLRQISRILRDHHTFSVEVCLPDVFGTQTPPEKSTMYQFELDPARSSTLHMSWAERTKLRIRLILFGHTKIVRDLIAHDVHIHIDVSNAKIEPKPIKVVGGVCERRFQAELDDGEINFVMEFFPEKLVPHKPISLAA